MTAAQGDVGDGHVRERFEARFARSAEVVSSAPGRVNLLGEHTDYNGGFVLPMALPLRTYVALALRDDGRAVVRSRELGEEAGYTIGAELRTGGFVDYAQGVTAAAAHAGYAVPGFDAYVESSVPLGGGLSSSAALEVALLRALREACGWQLTDVELAFLARWGENNVVGAPVGVLDPLACVLASEGRALFLDTRTLEHRELPLPPGCELVVIDSGVRHNLADGEYGLRRQQCNAAAEALGVPELRDVPEDEHGRVAALPAPLDRRARHVLRENARVLQAVQALERGDADTLGALFDASHASLRDDFEVSIPRIDAIVERAAEHEGVLGARITGGGFGGSVVCLVRAGWSERVARSLARDGARALLPAAATGGS